MAGEQFAQADHVARLAGEERLDTYVYLNRDGTKSVYYMGRNVKFVDADGIVREKDTTLVSADGGYTMRQNDVNLLLPHNPADGVLMAAGGGGVRLVPQGGSGSAALEDNAVLYEDYYGQGMSLKYTPMLDGVKEDIILESYSGVSSFSFGLAANGLRLYERNGRWCLAQNATAEAAFLLGEILVYDAVGKPAAGTLTVQEVRTGVYTLTVSAPVAYLTDPTTVYPVTIDPTITSKDTMSTSNIEDATVFSGYPNNNFGNYVFNTIGYQDASYGTGRVAVRLKGLLNDATYQSLSADHIVSVQFYMKDGGSNYAYVNIHALTGNATWTESTVKNSNVGTASQTVYDSQRMGGGKWATFDLTDLAKDWKNGNRNGQCGFLMVIADSTKKIGALSCEYGSGDYWPYVVVNYAVSSVLNYTVKDINEGSSFALTADTGGVAAEITWTSSNTDVATVSSSGVVTGVKAGTAVITASSDVFTEPVSCTVYVTIPDGVYYIKNALSGLCLQGAVSSIGIYEQKTGSENRLNQLWKIHYLGGGYYVIRPMMDFAAALTTNNQGYAAVAAAAVEDDEVATGARWTIIHNSFGYAFKRLGSNTETLTPVVSGYPGSAVYFGTWSASPSCHWELESAHGVFLRKAITHKVSTVKTMEYVELGQTVTLADLDFIKEIYGGLTYLSWSSSNTSVATVDMYTGAVTGLKRGVAVITITATIDGTAYTSVYSITVRETISVINIYDSSLNGNTMALNSIHNAIVYLNKIFNRDFYLYFENDDESQFVLPSPVDHCIYGAEKECDSACIVEVGYHHKEISHIGMEMYNTYFEKNHVVVFWTDYGSDVFCIHYSPYSSSHVMVTRGIYAVTLTTPMGSPTQVYPSIHVFTINKQFEETATSAPQSYTSLILAHEIAHTLGLKELYAGAYSDEMTDGNPHLVPNSSMHCIMDSFSLYSADTFFGNSMDESKGLCDFCTQKLLSIIPDDVYEGPIPLE